MFTPSGPRASGPRASGPRASGSSDAAAAALLDTLYPPEELELRNALSRKDGYWPFVSKKEKPPIALAYGEFPLPFFSAVLDRACAAARCSDRANATFCDIGSGAGRLVLWAAATSEWRSVRGVELLPGLHAAACEKLAAARATGGLLRTADVAMVRGSWEDGALLEWDAIDVAFAYTTAFPASADGVLDELGAALTPRLRAGCVVVTTDYSLGEGCGWSGR